jgi:hypothetical protein
MKTSHVLVLIGAALGWAGQAQAQAQAQQPVADAKSVYQHTMDAAEAVFDGAKLRCDAVAGIPHEICVAEARAARVRTEEEAGAAYKNTLAAYTQARIRIASAYYERDKTRCGAVVGNDREVCLRQAKATLVATQADARADRTSIEARLDAREAKLDAEYRVALQKCDAFAGAVKEGCVGTAKTAYGK